MPTSFPLSARSRQQYDAYVERVVELNAAIPDAQGSFTVSPSIQQTMHQNMQESNAFLGAINMRLVPRDSGEKIGLSNYRPILKRTDVTTTDRVPVNPLALDDRQWQAYSHEFDTYLPWLTLDAWSFMPDFELMCQNSRLATLGNNIIMVGFNGTSAAPSTDPTTTTDLHDVNIGWLQRLRLDRPEQVLAESAPGTGKLYYGPNQEFKTIDALIQGAINELLPNWAKNVPMTAICGYAVTEDKSLGYINKIQDAVNEKAADDLSKSKTLAGRAAYNVPFFPDKTVFLTPLNNLSFYEQAGSIRRTMRTNPLRNREEDFQSSNAAFVIEDNDFALLLENIEYTESAEAESSTGS